MKAKDLRERSHEDLAELEKSLAKDVFENRLKNFTNRLDDTSAMKKNRRDLARVKTLMVQRKLGTTPVEVPAAEKPAKAPKAAKAAKPGKAPKAEASAPKAAASKPAAKKKTSDKTKTEAK